MEKDPEQDPDKIYPDHIYINNQKQNRKGDREEFQEQLSRISRVQYPFFLRILSFIVSFFSILYAAAALVSCAAFGVVYLLSLGQSEYFEMLTKALWEKSGKGAILGLGFFIATFNPVFGLSLIILFFFLRGSSIDDTYVNRFIRD